MNKRYFLFLILILLAAFLLRFYRVTEIPPSLNWDEVSIGYNAYSVLQTGRDEWGVFLPVHFKSYGEYKLPAQIYASIPGIAVFGLNELGVRITPVLYGTLTVLVLFFLARALFQSNAVGIIAAFLLAISPWHIHLTRASFESSFAVFWVSLGLWLLVKGFKDSKWLVWAMVPLAVSVYTYNSARVFTPLFLVAVLFIYRKVWLRFRRALILLAVIFAALMLPLVPFFFSGERSARYKLVSITDDPGLLPRINENRGNSSLPPPLPRLINNKVSYTAFYFAQHYLAHFSPDFLFVSGAPHKQHHVQGMGELYWFQAPFLLLGLYFLFKTNNRFRGLLLAWVLLGFIPVAITNDSIPHALRTLIVVPFYQLLTAYGIFLSFRLVKEKNPRWQMPAGFLLSAVVVLSLGVYLNNYYNIYPKLYSRDWQYGNKQAVDFIKSNQAQYDQVIFTRHFGEPHMFTLFYLKYDPAKFQNDLHLLRFETYDWVRVLKFDKYYFPDLGDQGTRFGDIVAQNPGQKLLFIGKDGDFPDAWPRLEQIRFLNGELAFEIVEAR